MSENKKIAFVGGDLRQIRCADKLCGKGFEVALYGFENFCTTECETTKCMFLQDALSGACAVILPLPASKDGKNISAPFAKHDIEFSEILKYVGKSTLVLGGKFSLQLTSLAKKSGVELIDYYKREELQILNAQATAEGAIGIALEEMPTTLFGSTCAVLGYGRIGKILTSRLLSFGAKVYASARKCGDLASIEINLAQPIETANIDKILPYCDCIFNTIPAQILLKEQLKKIRDDCTIIDLASLPGGVDFEEAKRQNKKAIWALSLPGKTAPISAGDIIERSILNIFTERGIV